MLREYQIVSPSLEGVLCEDILTYEGLKRPVEILRVCDGPASKGMPSAAKEAEDGQKTVRTEQEQKVIEDYFHDLYGIFMKKLSYFIVGSEVSAEDSVKLQAMLQEMIKVKKLMGKS